MSILAPIKIPPFRILLSAQVLSDLGNWLDFTALAALIAYNWKMGPGAIAALTIILGLPWVIIGPLASVWIDRIPRGPWMASCSLLRVAAALALFWAPNFYILLFFAFVKETLGTLFDPARQGAIGLIVPPNMLAEATSLSQLSVNAMKIVAPALGGLIIVLAGSRVPFLIESAGFFLSGLLLAWLPVLNEKKAGTRKDREIKKPEFWPEFRDGWRHIFSNRVLAIAIIMIASGLFIVFLYDGLLVLLSKALKLNQSGYGMLISLVGFGSVLGSVAMGQWRFWKRRPLIFMSLAQVFAGLLVAITGLGGIGIVKSNIIFWGTAFFLCGAIGSGSSLPFGYILQNETPPGIIGRVSASANALQNFSMLLAPALGALLAKWLGVGYVFLIAGIATTVLGIAFGPVALKVPDTQMVSSNEGLNA